MKVDKGTARYQPHPEGRERCGGCSMYRAADDSCTAVKGLIAADGWCKYWEAEGRKVGGGVRLQEAPSLLSEFGYGNNWADRLPRMRGLTFEDDFPASKWSPPGTQGDDSAVIRSYTPEIPDPRSKNLKEPEPLLPWEKGSMEEQARRRGKRGFGPKHGYADGGKVESYADYMERIGHKDGGAVIAESIAKAESEVDGNPTEAQKKSGNYAKGHVSFHGLSVAIENAEGSWRSGVDKGGKKWQVRMPAAYGYVKGTEGRDGDHVDVYLGPKHDSERVFVVDQVDAGSGKFDEHKALLFYPSQGAALSAYKRAFSDGKGGERIGCVTPMTIDGFKTWLKSGDTTKPLGKLRRGGT